MKKTTTHVSASFEATMTMVLSNTTASFVSQVATPGVLEAHKLLVVETFSAWLKVFVKKA
jgi:hypothetical protein